MKVFQIDKGSIEQSQSVELEKGTKKPRFNTEELKGYSYEWFEELAPDFLTSIEEDEKLNETTKSIYATKFNKLKTILKMINVQLEADGDMKVLVETGIEMGRVDLKRDKPLLKRFMIFSKEREDESEE